jgi:hypothetical protein
MGFVLRFQRRLPRPGTKSFILWDGVPPSLEKPLTEKTSMGAQICQHVRVGGQRCTQPARRNSNFCRFHTSALQTTPANLAELTQQLPVLEDYASIQIAIMKVVQYIMKRPYDAQSARAILYGLQLAANNLARSKPIVTSTPQEPATACSSYALRDSYASRDDIPTPL